MNHNKLCTDVQLQLLSLFSYYRDTSLIYDDNGLIKKNKKQHLFGAVESSCYRSAKLFRLESSN